MHHSTPRPAARHRAVGVPAAPDTFLAPNAPGTPAPIHAPEPADRPASSPADFPDIRFPRSDRGDEYPYFTERQMGRRLARHPALPLSEAVSGLPGEVLRYLSDSALAETLDALALNPLERAVAEMRLAGASVREIAAGSGLKKWRVERALAAVRYRLAAHLAAARAAAGEPSGPVRHDPGEPSGPVRHAAGWQDIYLAETRRRGKR